MENTTKKSGFIKKDEGQSYWMPRGQGEHITIKVSPWNVSDTTHTVFLHEIPPGNFVGEHWHVDQPEIFICLAGEGIIKLDDKEFKLEPEAVAYVGNNVVHSIHATGTTPLKMMVIITPSGLEERFKLMGKPRNLEDIPPQPFESGAATESHGVKKAEYAPSGHNI